MPSNRRNPAPQPSDTLDLSAFDFSQVSPPPRPAASPSGVDRPSRPAVPRSRWVFWVLALRVWAGLVFCYWGWFGLAFVERVGGKNGPDPSGVVLVVMLVGGTVLPWLIAAEIIRLLDKIAGGRK